MGNDIPQLSYDMTVTLFAHGCEKVALASVSASLYRTEEHDQAAGYYRYLLEHGVRLDKNLVLEGPHRQTSLVEAAQLVGECLDAGYGFDGVVALGDRVALGVVNALKEQGIAVGADVRVIGMDDSIYSRISSPAISMVRRNTGQLAKKGAEALLALLAGKKPAQTHVVVPHEVVERATTLGA
ncbi:MAG: substrate-binding domain-containing protein [Coriobacteriales bacterium]|nr:substrate-binding domain-containing protein [Coriobacteriales bacterium]